MMTRSWASTSHLKKKNLVQGGRAVRIGQPSKGGAHLPVFAVFPHAVPAGRPGRRRPQQPCLVLPQARQPRGRPENCKRAARLPAEAWGTASYLLSAQLLHCLQGTAQCRRNQPSNAAPARSRVSCNRCGRGFARRSARARCCRRAQRTPPRGGRACAGEFVLRQPAHQRHTPFEVSRSAQARQF